MNFFGRVLKPPVSKPPVSNSPVLKQIDPQQTKFNEAKNWFKDVYLTQIITQDELMKSKITPEAPGINSQANILSNNLIGENINIYNHAIPDNHHPYYDKKLD
jgi:hypothetical protein